MTVDLTPSQIKKKWDTLNQERKTVEGLWDLIEKFVLPFRAEFYREQGGESGVDWKKRGIYDSTAPVAAQDLAAAIQSNMINPSTRWFDMYFPDAELQEDDEAREWIEECANIIYDGLNESNFNKEAAESVLDMVGFGTTVIVQEVQGEFTDDLELDFSHVPLKEVAFEEDSKGRILNFYRHLHYTALQIKEKFYKDSDEKCPSKIKDLLGTDKEGTEKFEVIFCIWNRFNKADKSQKVLAPAARQYGSKYILCDGAASNENVQLGSTGGYYEMPAYNPRFRRTSQSKWGHGPPAVIMANILSANELVEMTLESGAKALDPPTLTTKRGLLSSLDLGRGGLTVVKNLDEIKEFITGARFDVGAVSLEDLRKSIESAFYVDQLKLRDTPAMTATEAHIRYELMQRLLGPTSSNFQTDWLNPSIERTFNIYFRSGKLPEMPSIVAERQGQYRIEYTGPMARSHKRDVSMAIERYLQTLAQYGEIMPEMLDGVDPDQASLHLGIMQGVPAIIMRSKTEIEKHRKERQEQLQAQQKAEMDLVNARARSANASAEETERSVQ